jgi:capsular exopolysaccharide synthesis family protein
VWHAIRHHPIAFAGVVLIAAAAAAGVWLFLPLPKLTGVLVYRVSSQPPALLTPLNENRVEFTTFKSMQAGLIKQRTVLNGALNNLAENGILDVKNVPTLYKEPDHVAFLEQKIQVDFKQAPELMRVTFEGNDDGELIKILTAIDVAYSYELKQMETGAKERRRGDLDNRRKEYVDKLEVYQEKLSTLAVRLNSTSPLMLAHIEDVLRLRLEQLQAEMERNAHELTFAEQNLEQSQRADFANKLAFFDAVFGSYPLLCPVNFGAKSKLSESQIDRALRADDGVLSRERIVALKELEVGQIDEQLKDKSHPRLAAAKADWQEKKADLDQYRAARRQKVADALWQRIADDDAIAVGRALERIESLKQAKRVLGAAFDNLKRDLSKQSQTYLDLEQTRQDITRVQRLHDQIVHEMDQIELEQKAPSRVQQVEKPYVTSGLEGNRRLKTALMAAGGVLLVGLIGLVFWETRNPRVLAIDDVAKALGLRVFGTVPPLVPDAKLSPAHEAALTEAIDTARTMLLYDNRSGRQPKSLLVTSATPGEGKTSLSVHLADSLTRAGFRTLLIDADLRNPSAHTIYQVADGPGLCEMLRGEATGLSAVQHTTQHGLDVLAAGRWSMEATQALASNRWVTIRAAAEAAYDFVVIDSSPVLPVVDTLLLARNVDGVLLSVMNQLTRLENVAESQHRLLSIGANVMGVVLNGIQPKGSRYGYVPTTPNRSDGEIAVSA